MKGSPQNNASPQVAAEDLRLARAEEILCTALQVFAEHGFAQTDVQVIADRVGVGKGTVYRHFASKEGLFLACARHARQWLTCRVDAAADQAGTPLEQLRQGMYAFISFFDAHPEVVELLIQERAHFCGRQQPTLFERKPESQARWHGVFQRLIDDGVIRRLPLDQIEEAISKFVFGIMFVNYFGGRNKPLAQQCDEIFDVLFNGLLAQPDSTASADKDVSA
jgi:AcrR family transcriptional regulator